MAPVDKGGIRSLSSASLYQMMPEALRSFPSGPCVQPPEDMVRILGDLRDETWSAPLIGSGGDFQTKKHQKKILQGCEAMPI